MTVGIKIAELRAKPAAYAHARLKLTGLMTFGRKLPQGYWLTLYDGTGYILVWSTDSFEGYCTVEGSLYQNYLIAANVSPREKPEQEFDVRKYEIPAEIVASCGLMGAVGVYTNMLALPAAALKSIGAGKFGAPLAVFLIILASHVFVAELDRLILKLKLHRELWRIYLPLVIFAILAVALAPSLALASTAAAVSAGRQALAYASLALLFIPAVHAYVLYDNGADKQRAAFFGLLNPLLFFGIFALGIYAGWRL